MTQPPAAVIAGDRESDGRDLLEAIEGGDVPKWTLSIQVMTEDEAGRHEHNPFGLNKVWPKADYPLIEVGAMELNRYPDTYFAEVAQAAFLPANIVPGIGFSPDHMSQARLFPHGGTRRYRPGINFHHIPINAPRCPFRSDHCDRAMHAVGDLGASRTIQPNSAGIWDNQPDFAEPPLPIEGPADRYDRYADDDHHEQPGDLFRLMTPARQQVLFDNTARAMGDAASRIKQRHRAKADPAYGADVAKALGL